MAGAVAGVAAVAGQAWQAVLPWLLPLAGVQLAVDALSGWFLLLVGGVTVAVGRLHDRLPGARAGTVRLPRTRMAAAAAVRRRDAAGAGGGAACRRFLVAWELMAVTSLVLVLPSTATRRGAARPASGTRR